MRPAELASLGGVAGRHLQRALGDAHRLGRDARTAALERAHGDRPALPDLTDAVGVGHPDALEDQLGRGRAADAHLVLELAAR